MVKIDLCLNSKKPGNYGFFCPVSKLHLTVSNPVDSISADRVTSYILRGLKTKVLIDLNGVVDLETGEVKSKEKVSNKEVKEEPVKKQVNTVDQKEKSVSPDKKPDKTEESGKEEVTKEEPVKEKVESKAPTKRGKKAATTTTEEVKE